MGLSLRLLGSMAIDSDGKSLELTQSRKTRALLAYLAANPKAHRRDRLCEMMWNLPDDPKGALRWSLSKIRKLVDTPDRKRVIADRETVKLDVSDIAVDFLELQDGIKEGTENLTADELISLLDLAGGEFLEGLDMPNLDTFQSWCVSERETVRQWIIKSLRQLIDKKKAAPRDALPFARRLVTIDPYDVSARVVLINFLQTENRNEEAKAQLEAARRMVGNLGKEELDSFNWMIDRTDADIDLTKLSRDSSPQDTPIEQEVKYCVSQDGVRIAYAVSGKGDPIVKTANWLNHLEYDWESPVWRHMLWELSKENQLIRYDERGTGLSDWDTRDLQYNRFLYDLETVIDASGVDRFTLFGVSQGSTVAIGYAVKHPERIKRLILYGGFSTGWRARNNPEEIQRREAMVTLMKSGWGSDNPAFRQMFTSLFLPDGTTEQMNWFNDLQRITTSPEHAVNHSLSTANFDIRDMLPKVTVPTLVLHCRNDAVVPFSSGQDLAKNIPGAKFKALEGNNHLILEGEPAWKQFKQEIRKFLNEEE